MAPQYFEFWGQTLVAVEHEVLVGAAAVLQVMALVVLVRLVAMARPGLSESESVPAAVSVESELSLIWR